MKPSFVEFSRTVTRGRGYVTLLRALDARRNELWCLRGGKALQMLGVVKTWKVEVRKV